MGSYHSYVGDAKLEDSKDNWYRISGLNISGWNFTPTRSSDTSTLRPSGLPVYSKLNNNDIGWYLGDKNIYSDAYVKIVKDLSGDTVHNNMYDKIKISGRLFDLKGNALTLSNLNVNDTHRYNGEIQKDISIVNADGGNVQLRPNDLVRDGNNKIYIYNSEPSNSSSSFRPMLTLKPKGGEVLERFTLKIKITRKFTRLTDPRPYRISFAQEVIEGNPGIIKETICRFGIGRNGADLPDDQLVMPRATADSYAVTLEPGELIAHRGPHGAANPASDIGILYKLINGKYLYIRKLHSLPGMEQPWPDNGGITTVVVTFTEADAYNI